jgi:hypothetical protein
MNFYGNDISGTWRAGGPRVLLALSGSDRYLGLPLKCLVQPGRNIQSLFQTVRVRAWSKPDWADYCDPSDPVEHSCLRARGAK